MLIKKGTARYVIIFTVFLFLMTGCTHSNTTRAGNYQDSREFDCIIAGKKFYFVPDEEKQRWVEPLTKLLANERREIYDRSVSDERYIIPDPDSPYIEQCYSCGLLDVTGDGVPELLIHPWGYFGSSGIDTYFIYDIYTGQKIGSINSGLGGIWCAYYDVTTEDLRLVNQYWLRSGWSYRSRYLSVVACSDEGEYYEQVYLRAGYLIDVERPNIDDKDSNNGFYTDAWEEIYPETNYWVLGEPSYWDEYYSKLHSFHRDCIRIPETELTMISWSNLNYDEDARFERAREMAEALVSSGQEFIQP